jgi:hypothetical protein
MSKLNISVIGDSNYRDLFTVKREEIEKAVDNPVRFDLATSVISVRSLLDNARYKPDVLFIAAPSNEITLKSQNNTRSHIDIIRSVVRELVDSINSYANKKETTMFVLMRPFLRKDPVWFESKLATYSNALIAHYNKTSPRNVFINSEMEIEGTDLKPDLVHLAESGMAKLASVMVKDIRMAVADIAIFREGINDDEDVPLSQLSQNSRKTPGKKKRLHCETTDDEESSTSKSKKKRGTAKIDTVLDKLDLLVKEMRDERAIVRDRFEKIEDKLEETIVEQSGLKEQIKDLKTSDNTFSATIREDVDAVDNLNSRDTVIIKKLKSEIDIPTDRKELAAVILEAGKKALREVLGTDSGMKFIAPLFYRNDLRPLREGQRKEYPPFKITFKNLPDAVEFKEKSIKFSKIETHMMYKSYVANQQNVGTRVRLQLLWGVVEVLKKEKKDCWVTHGSPKPVLQVKQNSTLIRSMSFVDAVTTYGDKIEKKTLEEARKLATRFFAGQVEKIFLVIKD